MNEDKSRVNMFELKENVLRDFNSKKKFEFQKICKLELFMPYIYAKLTGSRLCHTILQSSYKRNKHQNSSLFSIFCLFMPKKNHEISFVNSHILIMSGGGDP